ncbi:hypothetical protein TWF718_006377 [Orbilia javanica]|uniref:Uncharacterized protein n=1 Tax=Orbilia javanica TaxID=47235 RepID=A0AAN8MTD4_9PEZI
MIQYYIPAPIPKATPEPRHYGTWSLCSIKARIVKIFLRQIYLAIGEDQPVETARKMSTDRPYPLLLKTILPADASTIKILDDDQACITSA